MKTKNTYKKISNLVAIKIILIFILILISGFLGYTFNNDIKNIAASNFIRNDIQSANTESQKICTHIFESTNYKIYTIEGASMRPTLFTGDKLICDESIITYREGQIVKITTNESEEYVHRIKTIYDKVIITQGDNNQYEDEPVDYSQIDCVVVGVCY